MYKRCVVFPVHCAMHLTLYTLPRTVQGLLVRAPLAVLSWLHAAALRLTGGGGAAVAPPETAAPGTNPIAPDGTGERALKFRLVRKDLSLRVQVKRLFGLAGPPRGSRDPREIVFDYYGALYSSTVHALISLWLHTRRALPYEREEIPSEDGKDVITLDWLLKAKRKTAVKGVILVVPALGGHSGTPYIERFVRYAVTRGYDVCVLNTRGTGTAAIRTPYITGATDSGEIRTVLRTHLTLARLQAQYAMDRLPVLAVGYGVGGTQLIKALAEEEAAFAADPSIYPGGYPVRAAVVMDAPYDMHAYGRAMNHPLTALQNTRLGVLKSLRGAILKHPDVFAGHTIGGRPTLEVVRGARTMYAFNRDVIAPALGFASLEAYFEAAGAAQYLRRIRQTYVMCTATRTNPVTGNGLSLADFQDIADENPNIVYAETPTGGHLGYALGPLDALRGLPCFLQYFPVDCFNHYTKWVYQA